MLENAWEGMQSAFGLHEEPADRGLLALALRTAVVYAATLAIVRLGSRRFLSRATAFDVVVAIMLGSVVSRAINGSAPFVATLVGSGLVLVMLHWAFATLAYHTSWFGVLVKGEPVLLIRDGEVQEEGLREAGLSGRDLREALRLQGLDPDPAGIRVAYFERSGDISAIPYPDDAGDSSDAHERQFRVLEVTVEPGVQTVRLEVR